MRGNTEVRFLMGKEAVTFPTYLTTNKMDLEGVMCVGIMIAFIGLAMIFLPKTEWYQDNVDKHNYHEYENNVSFFRNIVAKTLLGFGIILFLIDLIF